MCTLAVTGSAVIAGLDGLLEQMQAARPEFGEEIPQPRNPVRA
jgi:hypothetical protein